MNRVDMGGDVRAKPAAEFLWWLSHWVSLAGTKVSNLGSRIAHGRRPTSIDGPVWYEVNVAYAAESDDDAMEVHERIVQVVCGCEEGGWCTRSNVSGARAVADEEPEAPGIVMNYDNTANARTAWTWSIPDPRGQAM